MSLFKPKIVTKYELDLKIGKNRKINHKQTDYF